MKIRSGFVSNSSSSSFVMIGIQLPEDLTINKMKLIMETMNFDWEDNAGKSPYFDLEEIKTNEQKMNWFFREAFVDNYLSEFGYVIRSGTEDGVNGTVIGKNMVSGEYSLDQATISILQLKKIEKEIQENFSLTDEAKIYCGTRMI